MPKLIDTAFAKDTLLACKGYDPKFISSSVKAGLEKILPADAKHLLPIVEGNNAGILNYTNLSVLYNSKRKVPFVSAYNLDGADKNTVSRTGFRADPRIGANLQLSQKGFYDLRKDITEFEIGHMAANNEMAWGTDAQLRSYQTFHFPNSVPQSEKLNTGLWKTLETYIVNESAAIMTDKKISVFTGPILNLHDPFYKMDPSFQIPILFFKVVVFSTTKGVFSTAFIMSDEQKLIEQDMFTTNNRGVNFHGAGKAAPGAFEDFQYKKVFQVNIKYLEKNSGLSFSWPGVKKIAVPNDVHQIEKIRKIKDADDAENFKGLVRSGKAPAGAKRGGKVSAADDAGNFKGLVRSGKIMLNIILPG